MGIGEEFPIDNTAAVKEHEKSSCCLYIMNNMGTKKHLRSTDV